MIQYAYTQKHIQIVQLTARKCLCSTACSVLTRGFKTQIAIAHLACEQQMTCKVSCTLQILSWFLILYLTDLLGMHPTEGHCWYTLSACLKLRHYKHSKKNHARRCGTWEIREVEPPNIDLHWKYGETLAPHCTYSPRSPRESRLQSGEQGFFGGLRRNTLAIAKCYYATSAFSCMMFC